MKALDNQIAREMQRSPEEREKHGVQKWEPFQNRIEIVTPLILNSLGEGEVNLDSLIVLSQSFVKALRMMVDDLGEEGLGKVRFQYAVRALSAIQIDSSGVNNIEYDVN